MPHAAARRALGLLACAAIAAWPAHAVYKWVDEKGVTHFSEHPPPDGRKATKIEVKPATPGAGAKSIDWKEREQQSRKARLEKDQKAEHERARAQSEAAERRARCLDARRQLDVLGTQVPVFSTNEKGERVYLDDKDRPAEIAHWKAVAGKNCD